MTLATSSTGVVLRSAGVALVLDLSDSRLPSVAHWGADCGPLDRAAFDALVLSGVAPVGPNDIDEPIRLAVLLEHSTGWTGRPGLSGSRAGAAWSPAFRTTSLELDGAALPAGEIADAGAGTLVVRARDDLAALGLEIVIVLDPSGVLRMRAALTNLGGDGYQVDELLLSLPTPASASEILDFAGRWGKERVPQRSAVTIGAHRREGRHGRTGADAATLLSVGEPGFGFARGEVWGVHTAWSGNHVHQVERVHTGVQTLGGGELLLPGEVRLAHGETYTGPWIHAVYGDGLDEVARRFHRQLRARPGHPHSARPVTINVWEAVYFDHDLDALVELADRAADLGIERFVLDDGWFGSRRDDHSGLGDWTVSSDVWPDGLHPLVDHVRSLGLQFGLWFEPEMVNPDSDLARAHPEWILATGDRMPPESRWQQVLDLGDPDCFAHLRDAILAILDEYDIGYIKWDHNRDLTDAGRRPDGAPGVHRQTLAVYRLMDEIRALHPGLEIESCSSGGARIDLEILERTDRVWVSDNNDPLDRQQMNRWTGQLLPPELMGTHIASGASHTTGRVHDLSFRALTALFGHLGVEWDLRSAGDEELEELRQWIALHKRLRPLLHGGDLVRLDHPDETIAVHGVVAPDRSAAVYAYVSLARAGVVSPGRVRLPGLDPESVYRVAPIVVGTRGLADREAIWWPQDGGAFELSGALLGRAGLVPPLLHPERGVLYEVSRVGSVRPPAS
ncbi:MULTISPECIES: alpha-galactosidase [unclassified Rathayibacter]|uniref:alpha-galactosidase n=1 Tax=unclassified Rathayibacter TaxID=2609250 RepID=UPI000F4B8BE1|nr:MULTISPECIES: alpha-galactosidase [unclassified Rathayibacter]ROP48758.1 alpha-galactosidase [Rathayibacter sp. PhB186]ROS49907.1 alpha-galactosidase [Rathayibacter sp. PhB185]